MTAVQSCAGCGRTIDGEANGQDAIYVCDHCAREVCLDCLRAHKVSSEPPQSPDARRPSLLAEFLVGFWAMVLMQSVVFAIGYGGDQATKALLHAHHYTFAFAVATVTVSLMLADIWFLLTVSRITKGSLSTSDIPALDGRPDEGRSHGDA